MSTITTATSTRPVVAVASAKVTGKDLIAAVHGGTVKFAKVRESGTLRAWPVLVPGSKERTEAEAIQARREAKETVEAIAKDLNKSVPTVRRSITALAFTLEVEGLNLKDRQALAKVLNEGVQAPAKAEPKAPAKAEKSAEKPAKAPAKSAPAKAKSTAPKATPAEKNAARIKRMQANGTAKVPAPSES